METIVRAAYKVDGVIYSRPKPERHCHIIKMMILQGISPPIESGAGGFITSSDRFVGRIEAGQIAIDAGQCSKLISPPRLTSEDVW